MGQVSEVVYICIFALVGIVVLCSFALPLLSEYMGALGDFYPGLVSMVGIVGVVLIISLGVVAIPRGEGPR